MSAELTKLLFSQRYERAVPFPLIEFKIFPRALNKLGSRLHIFPNPKKKEEKKIRKKNIGRMKMCPWQADLLIKFASTS